MKARLFFLAASLLYAAGAYGYEACVIEATIRDFMRRFGCEYDVSLVSAQLVSEAGYDYTRYRPEHMPDDLDVTVKIQGCQIDNNYWFTLREAVAGYQVVGYTAWGQPE